MFSGFTDETFQFFAAIRFNNNPEFFHANHDWYERAVREPLKDLAADLGETVLSISDSLETRPERVVSRINRDVRFSKDKSPYRDHMWLSFRRPGAPQGSELCIYVSVNVSGCEVGFGVYDQVRPLMNAIRREIRVDPEGFERDAQAAFEALSLGGTPYRRMKTPDDLPPLCARFYPLKGFWMFRDLTDPELLRSPRLAEEIRRTMREHIAPLYRRLSSLPLTEEDEDGLQAGGALPHDPKEVIDFA